MTKEEIEQYIDLDNKIKNRIVQISHALKGVKPNVINKFIQDFRFWNLETYDKKDFIENSKQYNELCLGLDCYNNDERWACYFDKNLLTMTDEQINEIIEYDKKKKAEDYKRKLETKKSRQARIKKEAEEKEYEQYLKLKKKFEKK